MPFDPQTFAVSLGPSFLVLLRMPLLSFGLFGFSLSSFALSLFFVHLHSKLTLRVHIYPVHGVGEGVRDVGQAYVVVGFFLVELLGLFGDSIQDRGIAQRPPGGEVFGHLLAPQDAALKSDTLEGSSCRDDGDGSFGIHYFRTLLDTLRQTGRFSGHFAGSMASE
jgi:hypothetical protein